MARNPAFYKVLAEMGEVHNKKNQDYADEGNPYSNFEGAAKLANVSVDTVFQALIGIKVERLRQLTSGKTPNYESIDDTLLDLANYAALWLSYRRNETEKSRERDMEKHPTARLTGEVLKREYMENEDRVFTNPVWLDFSLPQGIKKFVPVGKPGVLVGGYQGFTSNCRCFACRSKE